MLGNPYVEMLGSISLIMAIIVGYVVMLFIVLAALIYPIAKLGQKLVRKLLRIKSPSTDPFPPLSDVRFKDEPTQTILPPTTVPSWQLEDIQHMPGLSYLAGRPIEANSEDTQFMDKITTMHHQI